MTQLLWVVALVFLVTILQLAVYRYLGGHDSASAVEVHSTDGPPHAMPRDRPLGSDGSRDEEGRRCPSCGEPNDPAFTFCRRCVRRIGA